MRPGTYKLTYTLPGFNTVIRDGVELQANFTATINIDLAVGTLQESVTVSGASPVVDVQSNAKQQVLTRDVLNAVPTAGTIQGLGQLVVGVTLNVPDVAGSRAMQQTYFAVRGQGGAQTVVLVDGMMTNGLMGDGAVQAYHNESMTQEAVYQTAGGNAETLTGGVNLERTISDVCVSAASDPNRSRYCDQSKSGIPWAKQFKATVVYPLPFFGLSVSGSWQALNGYLVGTAAQAYGAATYKQPSVILQGRIIRVGMDVTW